MMSVFLLFLFGLIQFGIGYCFGFFRGRGKKIELEEKLEKQAYCHGFENGIYYTIDEYDPSLYIESRAIDSFKEYQCLKKGPIKQ